MDRADQPAEVDFRHDCADALEGLVGRSLVVERKEDPRGHLDDEEKQGHAAQKIANAEAMDRHPLVGGQVLEHVEAQPLDAPGFHRRPLPETNPRAAEILAGVFTCFGRQ